MQGQLDVLLARAWRLAAQRSNSELAEPDAISQVRPRFRAALEAQQRIFNEQRDALNKQVDVWRRRKDQYAAQMEASQQHLASLEAQLPLLAEELKDARTMLEKGYGLKPRVLGLERQVEAMKGDIASDRGKTASLLEQVSEADAQILTLTSAQSKQVAEEMQEVQAKIAETQDGLKKSVAKQGRRDVVAPVDGVTMNIRSFTIGGVVAPGGPLVDIVPVGEKLLVEARLQPTDIDVVHPDLDAVVRFVAYKQRTTPSVNGKVVRVSADAISDERSGGSYYAATVEVPADELARAPHVKLYPGMPVEIAIRTGSRTLLAYLMQPIADSHVAVFPGRLKLCLATLAETGRFSSMNCPPASPPDPGAAFLADLKAGGPLAQRVTMVLAHPDDEAIGAGGQLHRFKISRSIVASDGAPRDGRDMRRTGHATIERLREDAARRN